MFDVDELIKDCQAALDDSEPRRAVREALTRVLADASTVANALQHQRAGITPLHNTDTLTVLNVVWGPGMRLPPHDHRMWAAIGIYAGREDNGFFRRDGGTIVNAGGKELREGEVLLLGDDAIHSVTNPLGSYTGAIHVYGGDFIRRRGKRRGAVQHGPPPPSVRSGEYGERLVGDVIVP
jgi:predicted metal-dependent enzyme (double-stranded beta helix superfamily)